MKYHDNLPWYFYLTKVDTAVNYQGIFIALANNTTVF